MIEKMRVMVERLKNVRLVWWFVAAGLVRLALFGVGFHGDILSNLDWGAKFWEYGPYRIYENLFWALVHPNQPPGYFYLFAILHKVYEGLFSLIWWVNVNVGVFPSGLVVWSEKWLPIFLAKLPGLVGDLGLGYLILVLARRFWGKKKARLAAGLFLFNPALIYLSAVWGQVDSWVSFLSLGGLILLTKKRWMWGALVLILGYYTKMSTLVFLPVIGLVWYKASGRWVSKLIGLALALVVLVGLTVPFADRPIWHFLVYVYRVRVLGFQVEWVTVNAFNFWGLVLGVNPILYKKMFLGLSWYMWGLVSFSLVYWWPVRAVFRKTDWLRVMFGLGVIGLVTFLFLPGMHERYIFPLFPFLALLVGGGWLSKKWYGVLSLVYLLNMYRLWWMPKIGFLAEWLSDGNSVWVRGLAAVNVVFLVYLWRKVYPRLLQAKSKDKYEMVK